MGLAGLALAYGAWAVSLPPFSGVATAAVVSAGCAAMLLGGARRHPVGPGTTGRWELAPWAVLAAAAASWQLAAYLQQPREEHPTLSHLVNGLLDSHPARAVAFALWLAAAWALARR